MTEACPYCYTGMEHVPQTTSYKSYWKCASCNVVAEFFGYKTKVVRIYCVINGIEYSVRLDERNNQTDFTRWEIVDDGFDIGTDVMTFPQLLHITPNNIVEKIKLYLVFS